MLPPSHTLNDYNQAKTPWISPMQLVIPVHVSSTDIHSMLQLAATEMTIFLWPDSSQGKWESSLWFWTRCRTFSDCHTGRSRPKLSPALTGGAQRRRRPVWDPVDGGSYWYWLPMGKLFPISVLLLQRRDTGTCFLCKAVWLIAVAKK